MSVSHTANKHLEEGRFIDGWGVYAKYVIMLVAIGIVVVAAFVCWLYEIIRSVSG